MDFIFSCEERQVSNWIVKMERKPDPACIVHQRTHMSRRLGFSIGITHHSVECKILSNMWTLKTTSFDLYSTFKYNT